MSDDGLSISGHFADTPSAQRIRQLIDEPSPPATSLLTCPHCGHPWRRHDKRCADCGCLWADPSPVPKPEPRQSREYPYDGVISADTLYAAFWKAAQTLGEDESVHSMDHPYMDQEMDMIDTSGGGMPFQFWEHMARALVEDESR